MANGNVYGGRCPPGRVWLDQCDEALDFVKSHPGASASEVGDAIYPWPEGQNRDPAKAATTRTAFGRRRLDTLVDAGFVRRGRKEDGGRGFWPAGPPGASS